MVVDHLYDFTPLPKRVFFGPHKNFKGRLKILWDKNVNSQCPLHNVNRISGSFGIFFGRYVACLSVCLSALTHSCNVLIKSNITRKRFDAGYSNLEHWSYLIPSTIRSDMTSLTISGHVSAAIFNLKKKSVQYLKLAKNKYTKFETLIDNNVSCVSSTHDAYRFIHSTQKTFSGTQAYISETT